YQQHNTYPYSF
nr:immunoglobulin light chain junction region [Macaca mulatta]